MLDEEMTDPKRLVYQERWPGLNLGCGALIVPDHLNVDNYEGPGIDLVWDLDTFPWPMPDEHFERALALDIYEHVDKPLEFMNELWRVCKPGAEIRMRTTKWDTENSYRDPTHKRFLTQGSMDYWVPGTELHARYGAGYSGGRHFNLKMVWPDGGEYEWRLERAGRCEGACDGSEFTGR